MLHVMIGIFVFVGIIAVTALLFSGWAVYGVIRAIASGISALISSSAPAATLRGTGQAPRSSMTGPSAGQVRCPRARCHAGNPTGARFCRRCGSNLLASAAVEISMPVPQRRQVFATPAPARAAKRVAS